MRVKKAVVEVIKPHQLRVGDKILYSGFVATVEELHRSSKGYFAIINGVPDEDGKIQIKQFSYFYRVVDFTEQRVCPFCFRDLEEGEECNCINEQEPLHV
jgi:hypothetical protein